MSDMVAKLRLEATGGAQAAGEVGKVGTALDGLGPAGQAAGAGARKAANDIDHLGQVADATAMDLGTLYDAAQRDFVGIYQRQMAGVVRTQDAAEVSTRKLSLAGLGLSRQFADIGVTAAMGMNPLMILIQQGPQVADQLAVMKMEGLGLSQVMKGLAASTWAFIAPLAPLAAGAAVVGGALFLWKKHLDDTKAALAATKEAAENLLKTQTNVADALAGAIAFTAKYEVANDNLTTALDGVFAAQDATYKAALAGVDASDLATKAILREAEAQKLLTVARLKDAAVQAEARAKESQAAATKARGAANQSGLIVGFGLAGDPLALQAAQQAAADKFKTLGGEAAQRAAAQERDYAKALNASADALMKATLAVPEHTKAITAQTAGGRGTSRERSDAGRNVADYIASLEAEIAQASRAELQNRLSLSRDIEERASLQKQIIAAELAEKTAALKAQAARIANDKGLSDADKAELTGKLQIVQLIEEAIAAAQSQAADEQASAELSRQSYEARITERQNLVDLLSSQADLTKSAFARNLVEGKILEAQNEIERLKLEEIIASAESTANEKAAARARLTVVEQIHANEKALLAEQTRLVDAIGEADDAVRGFKDAWRRHDWPGLLDNVERALQTIIAASQQFGPMGGLFAGGSAVAGLVGGKTGSAISTGLGIAGLGASLGGWLSGGTLAAGVANGIVGLGGSAAVAGGIGSAIMGPIAAALGPIGLAAGALYAAAKIFNLGGKPSNHGAGYDLVTGQISGDKRNDETVQAVTTAAQAIAQATQLLTSQGITPGATVNGLVLGTRDDSQIYLSNGQTVTSAVGDAGAAVDAALRAMLKGATYESEAQKTLVENMLAAGKGFEDITAALAEYAQAQDLVKGIDDAILQLTDPKAWKLEELRRSQQAERDALQAAADAGNLTAEAFARASDKLTVLEGLQLAETMKSFTDAVDQSTEALQKQASDLVGSVTDRILELTNPTAAGVKRINDEINAQIAQAADLIEKGVLDSGFLATLEQLRGLELTDYFNNLAGQVDETAKAFQDARPRLLAWLDELRGGSAAELSPKAALAEALQQYETQLAKARGGDTNAIANITAYADRLISADRNATSSASDRLALRNRIADEIQGLADRGLTSETSNPAAAIAALQAPLATIAQASAADLAAAAAGGKAVVIANLPSIQAMYGDVLAGQTDRLVAANDRNAAETIAAMKEQTAALQDALSNLSDRLEAIAAVQDQASAAQIGDVATALSELAYNQRLVEARMRMAG